MVLLFALLLSSDLEADVRRYLKDPASEEARETLLKYGREAVPFLVKAGADRAFVNKLKFSKETDEATLHTLKKAKETKLELAFKSETLLWLTHTITTRAAAEDH